MTKTQEAVTRILEQAHKEQDESHIRTVAMHEEIMSDIKQAAGEKNEHPCEPASSGTR